MKKIQPIKIAMIVNDLNINGISNVIMNYCRNLDRQKFQVSIIAGLPIADIYKIECTTLGIPIVELPSRKASTKEYYKAYSKVIAKGKFGIVHIHGNSATITPELLIAWVCKVKVRIAHSHSTTCTHIKMHKFLLPFFNCFYTHGFACSTLAGKWLFGNRKFYVIPNGINTKKYKFNFENREKTRSELNIKGEFVIGHIGRFNNPKNHPFLLKVFEQVAEKEPNARLLLVGTGPDFENISKLINRHPYKEKIIVYGETTYAEKIYSALDVFVFPSKHEGLGIVLLEAQISGLPCIASDVIPNDVVVGDRIVFLNLNDGLDVWADTVLKMNIQERNKFFEDNIDNIQKYEITKNVQDLEKLYMKFHENKGK